jgi:ubiquinone/menaquinone biosynthesis C-methylase UbiE
VGGARTSADGLAVEFKEADAEALPFGDAKFDAVISTFGVMFTPNQDRGCERTAPGV